MDARLLRAFVILAEELHFTRASERIGITQPQMSQWIRRLEKEVKAPLLERSTRVVELTEVGEAVLPYAREAVRSVQNIHRAAKSGGSDQVGSVTLGYAGASSRPLLPELTRRLRVAAPGIELRLRSMVYAVNAPSLLLAGELDIAFSRRPLIGRGLQDHVFEYEEVLVALPSDHRLADRDSIRLEDLARDSWVMFPSGGGSSVRDMGIHLTREAGFVPKVTQEAPDSYTLLGLVAAGVGVTLTVSSVRHVSTPGMVLLPLAEGPIYLAATVLAVKSPTPAAQMVFDLIRELHPTPERPRGVVLD